MNNISNPTSPTDLPHDIYGTESSESSTLREKMENARMKAGELYDGAREKMTAGARSTDLAIRNNPYSALGLALGVGVLVGMLIARSGREMNRTY